MAKFECPRQVSRILKRERYTQIYSKQTIIRIYKKFCQIGTVLDLPKSNRPRISDEESTDPIKEILEKSQLQLYLKFLNKPKLVEQQFIGELIWTFI